MGHGEFCQVSDSSVTLTSLSRSAPAPSPPFYPVGHGPFLSWAAWKVSSKPPMTERAQYLLGRRVVMAAGLIWTRCPVIHQLNSELTAVHKLLITGLACPSLRMVADTTNSSSNKAITHACVKCFAHTAHVWCAQCCKCHHERTLRLSTLPMQPNRHWSR